MTAGWRSLGAATDLWDTAWTGFAYPTRKQVVALLGDGTAAGNSVIQESAKGYREGTLSFTAPDSTTKDLVRGYDESSATVTFTDIDGTTRDVIVLAFDASLIGLDDWRVTVRLQERTEPV